LKSTTEFIDRHHTAVVGHLVQTHGGWTAAITLQKIITLQYLEPLLKSVSYRVNTSTPDFLSFFMRKSGTFLQ